MNTKTFYIDIDKGRFLSEQGGLLTEWPTIAYGACPTWTLRFVRPDTLGNLQPIDVSEATAWHAAVDIDFDKGSLPMIRTLDEDIDKTDAVSGILGIPLNANNTSFEDKIGTRNSLPAFFEVRGYDPSGYVVYDYRMNMYALGAIDPQGSEPIDLPSGYATQDWTKALLRAAPEYRFSRDGESDWHSERQIDDMYYQTRYPEGQWSESILFVNGDVPEVSGYATKEYVDEAVETKQDVIDADNKLDYAFISNAPTIPTVNDAILTIRQGGTTKGTFTANASSNVTIDLDAGGGGSEPNALTGVMLNDEPVDVVDKVAQVYVDLTDYATVNYVENNYATSLDLQNAVDNMNEGLSFKQDTIDSENKLDYAFLSGTPTIPTVNNATLTIKQGGVTKGTFTANASQDVEIDVGSESSITVGTQTGVNTLKAGKNITFAIAPNATGYQATISADFKGVTSNNLPITMNTVARSEGFGHFYADLSRPEWRPTKSSFKLSAPNAGIDALIAGEGYTWEPDKPQYCAGSWEADFTETNEDTYVSGNWWPVYKSTEWRFTIAYDEYSAHIYYNGNELPDGTVITRRQDTFIYATYCEDAFVWNTTTALSGIEVPLELFPPGTIYAYSYDSVLWLEDVVAFINDGFTTENFIGPGPAAANQLIMNYTAPSGYWSMVNWGSFDITPYVEAEVIKEPSQSSNTFYLNFDGFYSITLDSSNAYTVHLPYSTAAMMSGTVREATLEVEYDDPTATITFSGNDDNRITMLGTTPTLSAGTIVHYLCKRTPKAGWYITQTVVKP